MVPQERATLLRMAGVAGFVDVVLDQLLRTGGTMRIVATRAGDLAFFHRMMRELVGVGALLLVAGKADFSLLGLVAHLVFCFVHRVA